MMKFPFISALVLGAALAVSGCVSSTDVSRDIGPDAVPVVENIEFRDWDVVGVEVDVPRELTVSEANTMRPRVDIVWREDPVGDRHEQVDALVTAALEPAFEAVDGATPVIVSLEMSLFHAQTHRVRYSFGGQHEIEFIMTVRHAETGELISGPLAVDLTFDAYGGEDAIAADARGETQRIRITERFQDWVQEAFIGPANAPLLVASN